MSNLTHLARRVLSLLREEVRLPAVSSQPGHVYRGVTSAEMHSIRLTGHILSTGRYSTPNEGTSFATDFDTAESYVNYGRDNPTVTGQPTYVLEVQRTPQMTDDADGYVKARDPVSVRHVTRVWTLQPDGSAQVASHV